MPRRRHWSMNCRWRSSRIGAEIAAQLAVVRGLDAHGDARQPHAAERPQHFRGEQVDARLDRELNLPRQAADPLGQVEHRRATQPEKRIAKLERAEPPAANPVGHLVGHRLGTPHAGRVLQDDVRAIVALQRAAAAGLDQARGKSREIVADAETLRPKRRPVGHGRRSRSSSVPNCTIAPGRFRASSSFQRSCSASPLTTVTLRSAKRSGRTEASVPTTSTLARGWRLPRRRSFRAPGAASRAKD